MNAVDAGIDLLVSLQLIASMSKPTEFRLLLQFVSHRRNALAANLCAGKLASGL